MRLSSVFYNFSYALVRGFFRVILGKEEMLASMVPPKLAYLWSEYKLLLSHVDEDYQDLYGFVDYKDKAVLDVGADYGSTASFFFEKGAQIVYGVEKNKWMIRKMRRNTKRMNNLVPIELDVSCPNQFAKLLRYNPDIVKVDCEGCERHLLEVDDSIFSDIAEYIIETHTQELFDAFLKKLKRTGYVVSNVRQLLNSKVGNTITLFYARKMDMN